MIDQVKGYVQYELDNISKGYDGSLALERAYGATSFVLYCGWNDELNEWWKEMVPKFLKAIAEQKRKESGKDLQAWKKNIKN